MWRQYGGCVLIQALLVMRCAVCAQELAEGDSLEEITLMDGATFHNLARQCRLDPRWHEQVKRCLKHFPDLFSDIFI